MLLYWMPSWQLYCFQNNNSSFWYTWALEAYCFSFCVLVLVDNLSYTNTLTPVCRCGWVWCAVLSFKRNRVTSSLFNWVIQVVNMLALTFLIGTSCRATSAYFSHCEVGWVCLAGIPSGHCCIWLPSVCARTIYFGYSMVLFWIYNRTANIIKWVSFWFQMVMLAWIMINSFLQPNVGTPNRGRI